jgi:hypothetical protein
MALVRAVQGVHRINDLLVEISHGFSLLRAEGRARPT